MSRAKTSRRDRQTVSSKANYSFNVSCMCHALTFVQNSANDVDGSRSHITCSTVLTPFSTRVETHACLAFTPQTLAKT